MNINRDNYEMYFLLYLDKELSDEEVNALHLFIADNIDLREELEMLQKSILIPENVIFNGKNNLLKKVNIDGEIEEKLLLYIDDELPENEVKKLQLKIAADEKVAEALLCLMQTKLTPDNNVIFSNKQSLYKKEGDRVVAFSWLKLAAAAVFVGFALWIGSLYFKTGSPVISRGVIANTSGETGLKKQSSLVNDLEKKEFANKLDEKVVVNNSSKKKDYLKNKNELYFKISNKKNRVFAVDNKQPSLEKVVSGPGNNLPKPYFEKDNENNLPLIAKVTESMQQTTKNLQVAINENNKDGLATQIAAKDVYNMASNDNDNENTDARFSLSDNERKKSKLAGFLRKAKRILERNTNLDNGDNNLKVANLAFTTH